MASPSLSLLVENAVPALIIIAYLYYEIHFGRLDKLATQMDAVISVVLTLARFNPHVDEEQAAERLGEPTESDLIAKYPDRQKREEEDA